METIIVTGGAGYIGSHTIIELLNKTIFQIVSIDNFSNSSPDLQSVTCSNFTGPTDSGGYKYYWFRASGSFTC